MVQVQVPHDEVIKVQRADIECAARRDIITHIMEKNINISTDRFATYQKEYDDKYFAFEQAKSNIERTYVRTAVENPVSWVLDYNTGIVNITTVED